MNSNRVVSGRNPVDASDVATKRYVDTAVPAYKVVTGTMSESGMETVILTGHTTKTPINGKLFNGKMWLERSANEWFDASASNSVVVVGYPKFQVIYNEIIATKRLYAWFSGNKNATWSGRLRSEYQEYQ